LINEYDETFYETHFTILHHFYILNKKSEYISFNRFFKNKMYLIMIIKLSIAMYKNYFYYICKNTYLNDFTVFILFLLQNHSHKSISSFHSLISNGLEIFD